MSYTLVNIHDPIYNIHCIVPQIREISHWAGVRTFDAITTLFTSVNTMYPLNPVQFASQHAATLAPYIMYIYLVISRWRLDHGAMHYTMLWLSYLDVHVVLLFMGCPRCSVSVIWMFMLYCNLWVVPDVLSQLFGCSFCVFIYGLSPMLCLSYLDVRFVLLFMCYPRCSVSVIWMFMLYCYLWVVPDVMS